MNCTTMLIICSIIALHVSTNEAMQFCVHDEDCLSSEYCVGHVCSVLNYKKRSPTTNWQNENSSQIPETLTIFEPTSQLNQTRIEKVKKQDSCIYCLGFCICDEPVCLCIPIQ